MIDPKLLVQARWSGLADSSTLRLAEVLRLFSKDSVRVRISVLCGLLAAEIVLRALMVSARLLFVFMLVLCASVAGLH